MQQVFRKNLGRIEKPQLNPPKLVPGLAGRAAPGTWITGLALQLGRPLGDHLVQLIQHERVPGQRQRAQISDIKLCPAVRGQPGPDDSGADLACAHDDTL